ncbi:MAG: phage terminase large subunit family protein [Pseudomonadota bacterium]|nr:phage terminase large subunit family protein [Pseudomonadota bacterium]
MKKAASLAAPPPSLLISQWADRYRYLSSEASAEPGKWNTDRAPYQREMMDAVGDPLIETVVIMSSAQIGKTEIINNVIGYHIQLDPAPILLLQPTLEMAEAWSKDRFAPMLRDTSVLHGLVKDPRSRDSGNTLLHKRFPGGHITMSGANSPASLASRPIRMVLCDEVDRYPVSAGTEGDPVNLAKKRSATFWNRKLVLTSTPTIKGASRIESAFEQSDQRRFHVPCPHCGEYQVLRWQQVRWNSDDTIQGEDRHRAETAHYVCEHSGCIISDSDKVTMLKSGKWVAGAPFDGIAGFHINEIYSPWVTFATMVADFLKAKKLPETLKTWVNTSLGETWEEAGESIEADSLLTRKESWGNEAPEDVVVVTAGVDVQGDRLEMEVKGWGIGEESWSLDYKIFYGDPAQETVWKELDAYLQKPVKSKTGLFLNIACTCIDSGGHHTQMVYDFCGKYAMRGVFAIKGMSQAAKPIIGRPTRNNRYKIRLYPIGVDTAKEVIYGRLRITEPGVGYCHFPVERDREYFLQLTAEKQVTKFNKGVGRREWIKTRARNEALDCNVYALAALKILSPDLEALAAAMPSAPEPNAPQDMPPPAPQKVQAWIPKIDNWMKR